MSNGLKNIGPRCLHQYEGSSHKPDRKEKAGNYLNKLPCLALGKTIIIHKNDDEFSVKVKHVVLRILAAVGATLLLPASIIGLLLIAKSKSHKKAYQLILQIEKDKSLEKDIPLAPQEEVEKPEILINERHMPVTEKKLEIVAKKGLLLPVAKPSELKFKLKPNNSKVTHPQGPQSPAKVFVDAFKRALKRTPDPEPKKYNSFTLPERKLRRVQTKFDVYPDPNNNRPSVAKEEPENIAGAPTASIPEQVVIESTQSIPADLPTIQEEAKNEAAICPARLKTDEPKRMPVDLKDIFLSSPIQKMIDKKKLENDEPEEEDPDNNDWDDEEVISTKAGENSKLNEAQPIQIDAGQTEQNLSKNKVLKEPKGDSKVVEFKMPQLSKDEITIIRNRRRSIEIK